MAVLEINIQWLYTGCMDALRKSKENFISSSTYNPECCNRLYLAGQPDIDIMHNYERQTSEAMLNASAERKIQNIYTFVCIGMKCFYQFAQYGNRVFTIMLMAEILLSCYFRLLTWTTFSI